MTIVTALAIETDMVIVAVLAIKTNMVIVTVLALKPICMAIVTVLVIETDIHGYRDRLGHRNRHSWILWPYWPSKPTWLSWSLWPSKPTFIFPELNQISNTRNLFQGSLWGIVHISLINEEVAKTVTSLLRCLCSSLAWPFLSLLKQVRWLRSLRAVLTTLGALVILSDTALPKAFFGGLATWRSQVVEEWDLTTVWEGWLTHGMRWSMSRMKEVWRLSISTSCSVYESGSPSPISYLEAWTIFCQASTIEPVNLANLMVSLHHRARCILRLTWWHTEG